MSSLSWSTKDYSSGRIAFSVSTDSKKNGTYGSKLVLSSGGAGNFAYFKYYNPGLADNDKYSVLQLIKWMRINAQSGSGNTFLGQFIFANLTALGTGVSSLGNAYWLGLGKETSGVVALRLYRGKPGISGSSTLLYTDTTYAVSTWYKLKFQIFTSSSNVALKVLDDTNEDSIWTEVVAIEDSTTSQLSAIGYLGFGIASSYSSETGTYYFDDIDCYLVS